MMDVMVEDSWHLLRSFGDISWVIPPWQQCFKEKTPHWILKFPSSHLLGCFCPLGSLRGSLTYKLRRAAYTRCPEREPKSLLATKCWSLCSAVYFPDIAWIFFHKDHVSGRDNKVHLTMDIEGQGLHFIHLYIFPSLYPTLPHLFFQSVAQKGVSTCLEPGQCSLKYVCE